MISFQCSACGHHYQAPEEAAGQQVICIGCQGLLTVPGVVRPADVLVPPPVVPPPVVQSAVPPYPQTNAAIRSLIRKRSPLSATVVASALAGALALTAILLFGPGSSSRSSRPAAMVAEHRPATSNTGGEATISAAPTLPPSAVTPESVATIPTSVVPTSNGSTEPARPSANAAPATFAGTAQPFLTTYCYSCHGAKEPKGSFRMDMLSTQMTDSATADHWQEVLDRLNLGDMPPPGAKQPTPAERQRVVDWLANELKQAADQLVSTGGRAVLRRLNRNEYRNTIRDLLGVEYDVSEFPSDPDEYGFDNIGQDLTIPPAQMEKYLEAAEKISAAAIIVDKNKPLTAAHRAILGDSPKSGELSEMREIISRFATRAFRRPVEDKTLDRLVEIARRERQRDRSVEQSIRAVVQAILCSPQFLFLVEAPGKLDDYSLAARLSYFLWSSLPDENLTALALESKLNNPTVMAAQVERMIADPKSDAFVVNFVGQWLNLRLLGDVTPDSERFPMFNQELEDAMRRETELFFAEILRNKLSVLNFLSSDFSMLNEPLAKHYDIANVRGKAFQRVALSPDSHRGGLLGQASILTLTSGGTETSPVVRGVWILERILGTPPPPPPPNVPAIESDTRGATTIREQLAKHRDNVACKSCHVKIDPFGFALENYDAVGQWRTKYNGKQPVDPTGDWPEQGSFRNVEELKQLLVKNQKQFHRCLTEKLLIYAIGRRLEFADRPQVDQLVKQLEARDYRLDQLVIAIAQSPAFGRK